MKVTYIVSRFPTVSETFVVREMNALAELGVEIDLRSLFPSDEEFVHPAAERWMARLRLPGAAAALGGLAYWLRRRPLVLLGAMRRIVASAWRRPGTLARSVVTAAVAAAHARELEAAHPRHIHAHFAANPALAAWLCSRLTQTPYSFTAHAHDLFIHQVMLEAKVREAAFVIAISDFNRRFLDGFGGGGETPVHVVRCGVEPTAHSFRPREIPAEGPIRAVCVAGLREKKGHRILFEAMRDRSLERLELDVVGDGEWRLALEREARSLGVAERVRFHGALPEPEVRTLLDRADLFVLPSTIARDGQMEGLPVALIEALAAGLPAVSTRQSGIPELIRDGQTGLLAEPGDAESLRAAVARLLNGEHRLDLKAARRLVETEFDVGPSAARLRRLFEGGAAGG